MNDIRETFSHRCGFESEKYRRNSIDFVQRLMEILSDNLAIDCVRNEHVQNDMHSIAYFIHHHWILVQLSTGFSNVITGWK